MSPKVALFAYDFPHRKTHDFILEILAGGCAGLCVIAAPKKALKHNDPHPYYSESLQRHSPLSTEQLCRHLGLPFFRMAHDDAGGVADVLGRNGIGSAIISGARIIPGAVISLFRDGVVNFHPGKIPETSGLDALYHTIRQDIALGVTTHYIDHRVDAGRLIRFDELPVGPQDTPEIVVENQYQLQLTALRRYVRDLLEGAVVSEPIDRPRKNEPLSREEKLDLISRFPAWRAKRVAAQQLARLLLACEIGDGKTVSNLLSATPELLNQSNQNGWSPLVVACFHQHIDVARDLIERGADVNHANRKGTSVLMYAKTKMMAPGVDNFELLDLLLSRGAAIHHRDMAGKTILDYVKGCGNPDLERYLINRSMG